MSTRFINKPDYAPYVELGRLGLSRLLLELLRQRRSRNAEEVSAPEG